MAAKVYLDTNVYKFSATRLPRLRVEMREVNWGGRRQVLPLHVPVILDPNERIDETSVLRAELDLLPEVAGLAQRGLATFLISFETQVELSGIPNLDSQTGYFYGAPHTTVQPPVCYSRILYGGPEDPLEAQYRFLKALDHDRFLELRRICGAQQGKEVNRNQLLDAFHLWCAEYHDCEYCLSLDFKLARMTANARKKPRCRGGKHYGGRPSSHLRYWPRVIGPRAYSRLTPISA
jgi:hypothetical protein